MWHVHVRKRRRRALQSVVLAALLWGVDHAATVELATARDACTVSDFAEGPLRPTSLCNHGVRDKFPTSQPRRAGDSSSRARGLIGLLPCTPRDLQLTMLAMASCLLAAATTAVKVYTDTSFDSTVGTGTHFVKV